jgi:peptidoglycan hydrolase-like protein with peptidoglycan-binding domain
MTRKALMAAITALASVLAFITIPPNGAYASTPICNTGYDYQVPSEGESFYVPAYGTNQTCDLLPGDGPSDAIIALQWDINSCYIDQGLLKPYGITAELSTASPDTYGPKTTAAVRAVQTLLHKTHSVVAIDGNYGPQTRTYMTWWRQVSDLGCQTIALP